MKTWFRVTTNRHTLVELLEFVGFPLCQLQDFCQHEFEYAKELSNLDDILREVRQLCDVDTKALVTNSLFDLV